jgi:hypothetical protein
MECPNCGGGRPNQAAHKDGCLVDVLLSVLQNRGHDLSKVDLGKIDTDFLWGRYGGPAADNLARELGLTPYPEEGVEDSESAVSEAAP